jgi:hypothetical protein
MSYASCGSCVAIKFSYLNSFGHVGQRRASPTGGHTPILTISKNGKNPVPNTGKTPLWGKFDFVTLPND